MQQFENFNLNLIHKIILEQECLLDEFFNTKYLIQCLNLIGILEVSKLKTIIVIVQKYDYVNTVFDHYLFPMLQKFQLKFDRKNKFEIICNQKKIIFKNKKVIKNGKLNGFDGYDSDCILFCDVNKQQNCILKNIFQL